MKNVFRFLGIAFVACSMLVACGEKTDTWKVTASANDDAMGTVTGAGEFEDGASCTLTATPNANYVFVNWSDGSTTNPYTFTVTADVNLVANFKHEDGIKVTFNGASWVGNESSSYLLYTGQVVGGRASSTAAGDTYPLADAFWAPGNGVGTYTDNTTDGQSYNNSVINYVEYYESGALQDQNGTIYGDWWAKNATINVSTFDATSMALGADVDATMFDARTAFVQGAGFAAAPTAPMVMSLYGNMSASKSPIPVKTRKF